MNWSAPLSIETATPGIFRSVSGPIEALHILDGWYLKFDGPGFRNAINLCIDASRGDASVEDARAAFLTVLIEAGVKIRPAAATG